MPFFDDGGTLTPFFQTIFAEMRGVSDADGNSPFWKWLQEHFFSIDFTLADYLTGIGKKALSLT